MTELPAVVAPAPYVVIHLASLITGLSQKAIRRKIEEGIWLEGREYIRGPDGHIYISLKGYTAWVEAGSTCAKNRFASRSQ
jgi:hypothetical protein